MKTMKKVLAVLLAVMMMLPTTAVFAASKSSPNALLLKKQEVKVKNVTYTGKKAKLKIKVNGDVLVEGKDFVLVKGEEFAKKAGKHEVEIRGIGHYKGKYTIKYTIKKADQNLEVEKDPNTVKFSKKKNRKMTLTTTSETKVTYKSNNKKVVVDDNGKVKIKKGLKRGTYKITVTAKETKNYNSAKKTIKIKVV